MPPRVGQARREKHHRLWHHQEAIIPRERGIMYWVMKEVWPSGDKFQGTTESWPCQAWVFPTEPKASPPQHTALV